MQLSRRRFLLTSGLGIPASLYKSGPMSSILPAQIKRKREPVQDAWIELNLQNMGWNLNKLKEYVHIPVMAVIKANAYGHGLTEIGGFLDKSGIDALMVCRLFEALELRESGVKCPILNFGPLYTEDAELLAHYRVSQSVFTEDLEVLNKMSMKWREKIGVHIHIDTGMGRMGIPHHKAGSYIEKAATYSGIVVEGISTTLTEDPEFDKIQLDRFLSLCRKAEKKGIKTGLKHAFSSAGIFSARGSLLDMVRPGILLYGYYPNKKTQEEDRLSLRPVLQLKSRVAAVKILRPGDTVSYHRAYKAKKTEKMAVIPVGYSDGYPLQAVGKGWVLIRGQKYPLIGGITANHLEARLPADSPISLGDEVVLLGYQGDKNIPATLMAEWEGISTYKIMLRLNPLLPRRIFTPAR